MGFAKSSTHPTTSHPAHRLLDRGERGVGFGAVGATGLGHIGPSAAARLAPIAGGLAEIAEDVGWVE